MTGRSPSNAAHRCGDGDQLAGTGPLEAPILDELLQALDRGVIKGAQTFVWQDGAVLCDVAVGEAIPGRPMTRQTVHNLYCGLKPIVALALARALEARGLDERAVVGDLLGCEGPPLTVKDLCAHNAGLATPDALTFWLLSPAERDRMLDPAVLVSSAEPGEARFSEVAAWRLVVALIEHLVGQPAWEHVHGLLAELELEDVWFAADGHDDPRVEAIGCYYDLSIGLPLLHDRIEAFWSPPLPCTIGGYASMGALGRWHVAVLRALEGEAVLALPSPSTLRRWTTGTRASTMDGTLRRPCGFALGFMSDLAGHGYGPAPSSKSFGHAGFLGNSFAFVDPAHRLVATRFTNGIVGDPRANVEVTRPRWVSNLYELLGLPMEAAVGSDA